MLHNHVIIILTVIIIIIQIDFNTIYTKGHEI
jgi:hypothetical protein